MKKTTQHRNSENSIFDIIVPPANSDHVIWPKFSRLFDRAFDIDKTNPEPNNLEKIKAPVEITESSVNQCSNENLFGK